MQSLTIFMQSWTIYLHLNNILELFVFRKIGWHPLPMWHYLIYPIINWYTKVQQKCCYEVRNLYSSSNIWEGLYIDVTGHNLPERLTIGNIYRPPHDNNTNKNIETFINEMLPFIDKLKKENIYAVISGDFNINLLQINEREKFDDFFDMMCTNNFYPKIMFPTRIAKRSHSLLDQIFCKVPCKEKADMSAAILWSGIWDHFPCVVNFKILNKRPVPPKYIYKRSVTKSS